MLSRELELSVELAVASGELAMDVYRREFTVDEKKNRDPVTEADRRVNAFLCERIAAAFPDDLVVGEESGHTGSVDADRAWFIDPVDGTSDFIKKNGEWSIMIGLAIEGRAVMGVVFMPATGDLYYGGSGSGAWHKMGSSKRRLRVSDSADATAATVVRSRSHPDPRIDAIMKALGTTSDYRHGSVGCKLAQISEQRADLYFNFSGKTHMWDTCGPEGIIAEAGGHIVDVDGKPLSYTGDTTRVVVPYAATTARLSSRVLEVMQSMRDDIAPEA